MSEIITYNELKKRLEKCDEIKKKLKELEAKPANEEDAIVMEYDRLTKRGFVCGDFLITDDSLNKFIKKNKKKIIKYKLQNDMITNILHDHSIIYENYGEEAVMIVIGILKNEFKENINENEIYILLKKYYGNDNVGDAMADYSIGLYNMS